MLIKNFKTMKKIILYFVPLFAILLIFNGCEKEVTSEDTSSITYYVDLQLKGDGIVTIPQGGTYNEPGFTADEGGTDASGKVQVKGNVDASTIGVYSLSYSVLNEDGFPATAERTVIVYDPDAPDTDISGTYSGSREGRGGGPVTIGKLAPGIFQASDMFGGFYEVVLGYGLAYRLRSIIQLKDDNSISGLQTDSPWGPWNIQNGAYDPATNTITHTVFHVGFSFGFNVTLEKQ